MVRSRNSIVRFAAIFAAVAAAWLTVLLCMNHSRAYAAVGDATNKLPADGTNLVVSADTCAQCFYSPSSLNYLYVPTTVNITKVSLTTASSQLSNFSVKAVVTGSPNSCDPLINYPFGTTPQAETLNPKNNAAITFSSQQQAAQKTISGNGITYKVFCVEVQTNTGSNVTFRLATDAGNLLGAYPGPLADQGTGYFASSSKKWSEVINFAPACGDTSTAGDIMLFDLDNGYSQTPYIRVYLTRYNKDDTGATAMSLSGDVQGAPDAFGGRETVQGSNGYLWRIKNDSGYSSNYKYQLQVTGIGADNKIRIRLPFDQVYSAFGGGCNTVPKGTVTADCSTISGSFSDIDYAGSYRVDIHFRDGPPSSGYTNTYTVYTDSTNQFSLDVPSNFRGYNGGNSLQVWADGLGKDSSGANADWVSLSGSPQSIGPCTNADCTLLEYDTGSGYESLSNGGELTTVAGTNVKLRFGWKNTAAAGGTNWTDVGNNASGSYDAGWDKGVASPASSNDYSSDAGGRLSAESKGSTVKRNETAYFVWNIGKASKVGAFVQEFRMVRENPSGEWFGGSCKFTLKIKYATISTGTIVSCDLSSMSGFVEAGEAFDGHYSVRYKPTGDPDYYPTITVKDPTLKITPGYPERISNPSQVTIDPEENGSSKLLSFSPPQYSLAAAGIYVLDGKVPVSAPDGIGGTTTFTVSCTANKKVGTKPYMRAYGGDVIVGADFGNPCSALAADVTTYAKQVGGDWVGAGTQFAARSNGTIKNFATATLLAPASPSRLAFANTAAAPPNFGGGFNSITCEASRFPATLPATGSAVLNSASSGTFSLPSGSVLTQASGQPLTHSTTVYVDGNLTIGSNILTSASWTDVNEVPVLYVIVRGNIYIKPGVTELNGMFIAQPTVTAPVITNGRIFTCFNTTDTDTADVANDGKWIANNCGNKLLVVGGFVAAKVNFLRSHGTLGGGVAQEPAASANIAEVIQYSPEYLIGKPILPKNVKGGDYQSIVSLSPVL